MSKHTNNQQGPPNSGPASDEWKRRLDTLEEIKGLVLDASNMAKKLSNELYERWSEQTETDEDGKCWQHCDTPEHLGYAEMDDVYRALKKCFWELEDVKLGGNDGSV